MSSCDLHLQAPGTMPMPRRNAILAAAAVLFVMGQLGTCEAFSFGTPPPPPPGCLPGPCTENGSHDSDCCAHKANVGCATGYHYDAAAWPGTCSILGAVHVCCKKDFPGTASLPAGVTDTACNNIQGNTNCNICAFNPACAWCHNTGNGEPACQNANDDRGGTCQAAKARTCTGCNAPGASCKEKAHSHCVDVGSLSFRCDCDTATGWYEFQQGTCSKTKHATVTCADASADQQHTHLHAPSTCAAWKAGGNCKKREDAATAKAYCLKSCGYCGASH